jgi:hypothetical protein
MGQKLDEHGFFERDEFEVASQEPAGRKPPRERLPLEGAPQRRRSFGHRKGHPGRQNSEGGGPGLADGSGRTAGQASEGRKRAAEWGEAERSCGGGSPESGAQRRGGGEPKRMRWGAAWGMPPGAGPLHSE